MYLVNLRVIHRGCSVCELPRKHRLPAKIFLLNFSDKGRVDVNFVIGLNLNNKDMLKTLYNEFRSYEEVKEVYPVSRKMDNLFFIRKRSHGILRLIEDLGGFLIPPVNITNYGVKEFKIFLPRSSLRKIKPRLQKDHHVIYFRINYKKITSDEVKRALISSILSSLMSEVLTNTELRALKSAYYYGLFNRSRSISLNELARMLGISRCTLIQHIRKAQRKIFSTIFEC